MRPFCADDAPLVQRYAGAREVAAVTLNIPHPYPDGGAELWIATHAPNYDAGKDLTLAVTLRETGELMGAMSLMIERDHQIAELGYWMGLPYWGQGYATEAAQALVDFGFSKMALRKVFALHFGSNVASGRVMQKIGMTLEGVQRKQELKWERVEDLILYGILREEWQIDHEH